jgi:hypothetical protein
MELGIGIPADSKIGAPQVRLDAPLSLWTNERRAEDGRWGTARRHIQVVIIHPILKVTPTSLGACYRLPKFKLSSSCHQHSVPALLSTKGMHHPNVSSTLPTER